MNIPGFTAEASVFTTDSVRYRVLGRRTVNEHRHVVPQAPGRTGSFERADWIRETVGFGRVFCWFEDCDGICVPTEVQMRCGWWPY